MLQDFGIATGELFGLVRRAQSARPDEALDDRFGDSAVEGETVPFQFGAEDLDRMVSRFGDTVVGRSEQGSRSLDLTEATRRALGELGVEVRSESPDCTAALASDYWSHRARGERGRIALTVWLEPA